MHRRKEYTCYVSCRQYLFSYRANGRDPNTGTAPLSKGTQLSAHEHASDLSDPGYRLGDYSAAICLAALGLTKDAATILCLAGPMDSPPLCLVQLCRGFHDLQLCHLRWQQPLSGD